MKPLKLYHGTNKKAANKILKNGWNKNKSLYLTDDYDLAAYYAECAMEDIGDDECTVLTTYVSHNELYADRRAFEEPISLAYKNHVSNEEEWHEKLISGEIPFPELENVNTSLEYTNSVLFKGNINNVLFYKNERVCFHVTPEKKLKSIMKKGIIPLIGENSEVVNEKEPRIYLFPTLDDADTALGQWMGDLFDEEEDLVILEIDTRDLKLIDNGSGFELECADIIKKDKIKRIYNEYYEVKNIYKNKKQKLKIY